MMASSMFGAKQRISEPLSALAVHTGRYREIKHPRPNFSQNSTIDREIRVEYGNLDDREIRDIGLRVINSNLSYL